MSPELKKIIVDSHIFTLEDFPPDFDEFGLGFVAWRNCGLLASDGEIFSGGGRALRSTLPLSVSGSFSSVTMWEGTM